MKELDEATAKAVREAIFSNQEFLELNAATSAQIARDLAPVTESIRQDIFELGQMTSLAESVRQQVAEIGSLTSLSESVRQQVAEIGTMRPYSETLRQQVAELAKVTPFSETLRQQVAELSGITSLSESFRQQVAELGKVAPLSEIVRQQVAEIGSLTSLSESVSQQVVELGSMTSLSESLRKQVAEMGGFTSITESLRQQMAEITRSIMPADQDLRLSMAEMARSIMPVDEGLRLSMAEIASAVLPANESLQKQMAQAVAVLLDEADRLRSPDEFGDAIQETAPEFAKKVRALPTRRDVLVYLEFLAVVIQLALLVWGFFDGSGGDTINNQIVFDTEITNVTHLPPAPPVELDPQPPVSGCSETEAPGDVGPIGDTPRGAEGPVETESAPSWIGEGADEAPVIHPSETEQAPEPPR